MTERLTEVLEAIDRLNSADPTLEPGPDGDDRPAALLYGQRMSAELARLFGDDLSDVLKIAARGQHVERWKVARESYPEGRVGYLNWRRDLGQAHGATLARLMAEAGYGAEDCARVEVLLRKQGIKRDEEVQRLEDTICFVFIRHYFADFAAKHPEDKVLDIVAKTARKMSPEARDRVLAEFDLPGALASAVQEAA